MLLPWLLSGALLIIVLVLCAKLHLMKKSIDEICEAMAERLSSDTNTLISVSSRDRHVRRLAGALNGQLRLLRAQRRRYLMGDRELKEAVTNISHDLRTPLTAICGYLDLLEREDKSADAARYLALIGNRAEALKQLTEELFRYSVVLSTAGELRLEAVDVNAALEESVAAFYGALTERGIVPTIRMPEGRVLRQLDRAALSRVFGNVLANAIKYSDGDLDISLDKSGVVTFTNSAAGLDEVQVGRLFDRFFSVEAARNSTGLGLAISKALVAQMGGEITARYQGGRLSICVAFNGISSEQ